MTKNMFNMYLGHQSSLIYVVFMKIFSRASVLKGPCYGLSHRINEMAKRFSVAVMPGPLCKDARTFTLVCHPSSLLLTFLCLLLFCQLAGQRRCGDLVGGPGEAARFASEITRAAEGISQPASHRGITSSYKGLLSTCLFVD